MSYLDDAIKLLRGLDALFADEKIWTQYADARNGLGLYEAFDSASAVCWCLRGGFFKVSADADIYSASSLAIDYDGVNQTGYDIAADALAKIIDPENDDGDPFETFAAFNDADKTTFAEVKAIIKAAIISLEARKSP